MGIFQTITVFGIGLPVLAACNQKEVTTPTVYQSMTEVIAPRAQDLWDISNKLWDDEGDVDGNLISDEEWKEMEEAANALKERALQMSRAEKPVAAEEGTDFLDQGLPGALGVAEVQALLLTKPQDFREHAAELAEAGEAFIRASRARDAAKVSEIAGELDHICEECHVQFWYPSQSPVTPSQGQ